jgi:hypothetical protein
MKNAEAAEYLIEIREKLELVFNLYGVVCTVIGHEDPKINLPVRGRMCRGWLRLRLWSDKRSLALRLSQRRSM